MDKNDVDICQASKNTDVLKEKNVNFVDNLKSESGTCVDQHLSSNGANDFESLTRPISAVSASSVSEDSFFTANDSLEDDQSINNVFEASKNSSQADPSASVPDFSRFSSPTKFGSNHSGFGEKSFEDIAAEIRGLDISQDNSAADCGSSISDDELCNLSFPEVPQSDPRPRDSRSVDQSSIDGSVDLTGSLSKSYLYSSVSLSEDIPNLLQDDGDHLIPKFQADGRRFCWPMDKLPLSGERKFEEDAQWKITKPIGNGAFGQCFLGHPIAIDKNLEHYRFCVKKCQYNEEEVKALCLAAKDIFTKTISEGAKKIVSFYGATYYKPDVCIFMEYMEGGTVRDAISEANKQYKDGLNKTDCMHYFKDVLLALEFIHKKGIVHNDVKANNVLLTASKFEAKLCDFGKAAAISWQNMPSRDVWSGGCFLLDMLGKKYSPALRSGISKKSNVLDRLPSEVDQETKEALSMCFRIDRDECTATYVLTSKFFEENLG